MTRLAIVVVAGFQLVEFVQQRLSDRTIQYIAQQQKSLVVETKASFNRNVCLGSIAISVAARYLASEAFALANGGEAIRVSISFT